MMKKLISCLLVLLLCLGLPMNVLALDISVTEQGEVAKGQTVVYEVTMAENMQVKSGSIKIVYDRSVLTVVDYKWHIANTMIAMFDPATGNGAFACMMPVNVGDLIFSITFQVAEDAQYGELPVSLTVSFKDLNDPSVEIKGEQTDDVFVSCGDHQPGEAPTCEQGQTCTVCGFELVPPLGHTFGDTWDCDANQHWQVCTAEGCDVINEASKADHYATGENAADCLNAAICDFCGESFGGTDPANHTGNTVVKNAYDPTCSAEGYTGDTYCADCDTLISTGSPIPATGDHSDADGMWEADSDAHFRTCACGHIFDISTHNGGIATCTEKAICQVCGEAYGEVNPDVHAGGTYLQNQKESTCFEEGYTGDVTCASCDTVISYGSVIEMNDHNPADVWSTDEAGHWKDCGTIGCGNLIDYAVHTGGKANCINPAICQVCNVQYGGVDSMNHENTQLQGEKAATEDEEGYTGDVVCLDCLQMLSYGEVIPKLDHTHNMNRVEAKPQSCTSEGNILYWYCNKCGKYYTNENGTGEISLRDTVIPKDAHSFTELKFDDGSHWYQCSGCSATDGAAVHSGGTATCQALAECAVCGKSYGTLAGHDYIQSVNADALKTAATCVASAEYYESCSVCGELSEDTFTNGTVDADNHVGGTYVVGQADATCESDGYTGDVHCESCQAILIAGQVIPGGHAMNYVEAVEADHYQAGNIGHYACRNCHKLYADEIGETELTAEEIVVPKGEHAFSAEYSSDENDHWFACDCGEEQGREAHSFGDWTVTQEATKNQKGSKERTCGVCGYTATEEIPALEEIVTPPTGDTTNLMLWSFLMILSAIGAGLVLTVRRKQV